MKLSGRYVVIIVLLCICNPIFSQDISVIPEPVQLKKNPGTFVFNSKTALIIPGGEPEVTRSARMFIEKLQTASGLTLSTANSGNAGIQLIINQKPETIIGQEGYTLDATSNLITIKANNATGIFYGLQTLVQLLPDEIESKQKVSNVSWQIPLVSIVDYPRFSWRGIMLDVSRHFFPKEYVKNYIDQMARYKFNRFHWHLTDDQGWRVEIKALPRLTSVGAWRVPRVGHFGTNEPPKPGEKPTEGGFYTQDDIKEVVQYAKERYIEILPEIDVPGHSMAALAAYPELCVTKDTTIKVNPGSKFSTWHGNGKFTMHIDNTLNPADENVYKFLDKVFTEVATLFPFEFIHIGGDECYKGYWEKDPKVTAFMKANKIKNAEELQSYFTKRLTKLIMDKNKKVIGWDEILEGGLAPGAAVMSWRGTKGGIEAAHQKHQVVMSPNPMYYLDMGQGEPSIEPPIYNYARLKDTYAHEPLPAGVDSTFILGGQGNLWTEQIPTTHQVEYMTYPRAFAVSESLWSPKYRKNWSNFIPKVEDHFKRFDFANINYSTSLYDPIINVKKKGTQLTIELSTEVEGLTIHYTVDNTIPGKYSPAYTKGPLVYPDGADNFRVITYKNGKPIGRLISLKTEDLTKRGR
ncbi:beta-N-acetylhexosaminidase [Chryseosolibacter indicus]|uniref:beta-N-acetylhexosaminidase n=1 Tax=Chryseosolibacter indicus TaxID=2782351 RepID=A0ABS5VLH7_9BACT|nr:family 20 glycosylhydrolase [Chryseosolibacter indicus]MBT1701675.1 family 20 glycosylhydrolase [Chryseosolibacter indicus]